MKHLLLVLFAGDYLDASRRRMDGLSDRYRHHGYALESLSQVSDDGAQVSVIQMHSSAPYDETVDGIRFLGLGAGHPQQVADRVADFMKIEAVTHVMVRSPSTEILREVIHSGARGSVALADSFPSPWRRRHRRRYRELGSLLRHPAFDFVANHQRNSSTELSRVLRVPPAKVVPWDWPLDLLDQAASVPVRRPEGEPIRLCYVGTVTRTKGVWDLLRAVAILRRGGHDVLLEVAGGGDIEGLRRRADRLGIGSTTSYRGRVGGDDVIEMMQRSSFVCVPSHQSYAEGLPLTLYEAMAAGTPIIASNHRMFHGVVRQGETGFVFPCHRPRRLARAVIDAWTNPDLYEHVSRTAAQSYPAMGHPTLWGDLLRRWVHGTQDDMAWISDRALAPARPSTGKR